MKLKLAVPENKRFEKLYNNTKFIEQAGNIELYKVEENQCHKLLLSKRVDAALISPVGYAAGVKMSDLRVIPASALSSVGYTGLASIYFREGIKSIQKAVSQTPNDFLIKIARILLAEKYGVHLTLEKSKSDFESLMQQSEAAIIWRESKALDNALDVSEEWFDLFEMPLPLLVWACWEDSKRDNITQIIKHLSSPEIKDEETVHEKLIDNVDFHLREGKLFWTWTDEIEQAFEQILHFLYYHQMADEIAAVKVLDRD